MDKFFEVSANSRRDTQVFVRPPRVWQLEDQSVRTNYTRDRLNLGSFLLGTPEENQSHICDVQNDATIVLGLFAARLMTPRALSHRVFSFPGIAAARQQEKGKRDFSVANETSPSGKLASASTVAR